MQNIHDRSKLAQEEESRFIEQCKDEFVEKSLAATNSKQVKTLSMISYLPNLISAITAGFFVVFLLGGYPRHIAFILGALMLSVVLAVEVGKRGLIGSLAKGHFTAGKFNALAAVALVVLIGVSMTASYQGGKQLITETATPPPRESNPQIDSLNRILADQQATIDRLQRTTWKGKVTSEATRGITQAKKIQASLIERITALQAADDSAYTEKLTKQSGQRLNFGYILGALGALADAFLLGLLWTVKRLRYEVAAIHYKGAKSASVPGSAYLTGTSGVGVPPASLNQAEKERRRIGFHRDKEPDNDKSYNDESYNDESYNGESYEPEREVVTVTEREVVELTDRVKTCAHCGEKFVYYSSKAKYCSDACRIAAWEGRTGKKWNFKPQKN
ncbi:MAG: hypothetical protein WA004_05050 [Saprospiraceae bacterium]